MRRLLSLLVLCLLAAGCGEPPNPVPPPPAPAPLLVDAPVSGDTVRAVQDGDTWTATLQASGTAQPGQQIKVDAGCHQVRCTSWPVADQNGAWKAQVEVTFPVKITSVDLQVADALQGGDPAHLDLQVKLKRTPVAKAHKAAARQEAQTTPAPSGAPGVQPRPLQGQSSAQPQVLVVGDSLEEITGPHLAELLPGAQVTVRAEQGYSSPKIYGLFQRAWKPEVAAVVFDAGTNDDPAQPWILRAQLRTVADTVGARCLVVPTVHLPHNRARGLNGRIAQFAGSRPGTLVPDWDRLARQQRKLLEPDGIHPTETQGGQARARLIAQALNACL